MKFFEINKVAKVFVHDGPVSMAKGFPGLGDLANNLDQANSGNLFLFVNRKKNYCKVLWYHNSGHCILAKKLEQGHFLLNRDLKKFALKDLSNFLLGQDKELRKEKLRVVNS